jgi:hypothetical protein
MAGRIVNWFGENTPQEPEEPEVPVQEAEPDFSGPGGTENVQTTLNVVKLDTEAFVGSALSLYSLPQELVMDAMITPDPLKAVKLVELFKLAIDPRLVESLEILSWGELTEALSQWIELSGPDDDSRGPRRVRLL